MTSRMFVIVKLLQQTFSIGAFSTRISSLVKSISATIQLQSVVTRISGIQKVVYSSFSLQTIAGRIATIYESLQQGISTTAIAARIPIFFNSIIQSLQITSAITRSLSFARSLLQSIPLSSSASRLQSLIIKVFSSFSFSDLAKGVSVRINEIKISLTFYVTGAVTRVLTGVKVFAQSINVIAISSRIASIFRILTIQLNFLFSLFKQRTIAPPSSSQTVYVEAYTPKMVNATNITNTTVEFLSNETIGNVQVNSTLYTTSPVGNISEIGLKYVNLTVSSKLNETNLMWNLVKIYYTDEELSALGLEENSLAMWRYNTSSQTWTKLTTNLDFVYETGVNKSGNHVWANLTSFSLYAIGGLKANGQYCSENTECYSGLCCNGVCQSECPTGIPPPSPGAGAGVGAAPVVVPPTVHVEFSKMSVLREVMPGQSIVTGIIVKNKGDSSISELHVDVSGIPREWVTVSPESLDLGPAGSGGFSIGVSVPDIVAFGDYKVVVTLKNQNVEDKSFFILRIKSYTKEEDKPKIMRIVEIDRLEGKTNVELDVYNSLMAWRYAEVVEYVPKDLANSTDFIEFNTTPSKIIQKDPVVSWEMIDLAAGETRKIYYSASKILEEFTQYIYWPLKELSLVKTKPISGLEIVDLKFPTLYAGRSSIATLTIRNLDNSSHRFGFELKVPNGWKTEPKNITAVIKSMETRDFKFSIIVPEKTIQGYYVVRGEFLWDDSTTLKEYGVRVAPFNYLLVGVLISIAAVVAVVIAYVYIKRREMERRTYAMKRLESVRKEIKRSYS
jgi:hypothetical protein